MLAMLQRDRMSSSCMQYAADGLRAACSQRHATRPHCTVYASSTLGGRCLRHRLLRPRRRAAVATRCRHPQRPARRQRVPRRRRRAAASPAAAALPRAPPPAAPPASPGRLGAYSASDANHRAQLRMTPRHGAVRSERATSTCFLLSCFPMSRGNARAAPKAIGNCERKPSSATSPSRPSSSTTAGASSSESDAAGLANAGLQTMLAM